MSKCTSDNFRAIILAGGNGERFWPLSTASRPKQFLKVFGNESLIRQSVSRISSLALAEDTYIITSKQLVKTTVKELPEIPVANIVGEPTRRDTGAAVAVGVGAATDDTDPVIGFFPSDQLVGKPAKFRATIKKAIRIASRKNSIVVIGITPNHPATEFGYINPKNGLFVEKPDLKTAKKYLKDGYLWNAGMFIARASVFQAAFNKFAPQLTELAEKYHSPKELRLLYKTLSRISFDYAIMEPVSRNSQKEEGDNITVEVVPGDFEWDDVGSLLSFDKYFPHDCNGNVCDGPSNTVEATNNICVSRGAKISLLGTSNLVVITTPEYVLVADKSHVQNMKKLFL